ncbi:ABC transporter ATP-binding protein [Mediannikoviicoccus vaginalis]|uniref:ABC transporter ATP-binding protein n=1 Tax=Mediannikoviicoccus vaginalis TaxID=2899727 RepID=UPI001F166907|nr:ABC transporter ATP-binding protein [Mediannikoviicoccus vaginalis]
MEDNKLLVCDNIVKHFTVKETFNKTATVHAVEDVSFYIKKGETLGVVGESGCGKTTLGRTILRLHEPTSGRITYDGEVIFDSEKNIKAEMYPYRRKMQIIFQDPSASLDPRMTVAEIVGEALDIHGLYKENRRDRINELLRRVGLNQEHSNRYPHEFSGGQQQRIGIARALAVEPEFIVCDEPISALDVSIQAQIVNMLQDMQEEFGLTYMFIAHDLSVVKHISDRIAVMYLGKMVELVDSKRLYENPLHPYTKSLLSAIPLPDPKLTRSLKRIKLEGEIPSPIHPPKGCRFHERCPYAKDICSEVEPEFREVEDGHFVSCHII